MKFGSVVSPQSFMCMNDNTIKVHFKLLSLHILTALSLINKWSFILKKLWFFITLKNI